MFRIYRYALFGLRILEIHTFQQFSPTYCDRFFFVCLFVFLFFLFCFFFFFFGGGRLFISHMPLFTSEYRKCTVFSCVEMIFFIQLVLKTQSSSCVVIFWSTSFRFLWMQIRCIICHFMSSINKIRIAQNRLLCIPFTWADKEKFLKGEGGGEIEASQRLLSSYIGSARGGGSSLKMTFCLNFATKGGCNPATLP